MHFDGDRGRRQAKQGAGGNQGEAHAAIIKFKVLIIAAFRQECAPQTQKSPQAEAGGDFGTSAVHRRRDPVLQQRAQRQH
jgi:hypothetical protein